RGPAGRGGGRDEGGAGGDDVGEDDALGVAGPVVREGDGVGEVSAGGDGVGGVGLGHGQVGRGVAEVVGRVVVGDGGAGVGVPAGDGAGVGLLAGQGGGRLRVDPRLGEVEQAVAVGVAGEAGDGAQLVVADDDV